ncbi:MAG: hypothetical protein ABSE50_06060 [Xanthobacteraceae bacterium]
MRLFGISRRGAPTLGHAPQKITTSGVMLAAMQSEKTLWRKLVQITISGAYALINSRTILNHIEAELLSFHGSLSPRVAKSTFQAHSCWLSCRSKNK